MMTKNSASYGKPNPQQVVSAPNIAFVRRDLVCEEYRERRGKRRELEI